MTYSDASIEKLIERIGWYPAVQPSDITVSDENQEAVSGRYFNYFHQLVTVENVFACIPNLEVDNDVLNEQLEKLKKDAVLEVLNRVFDTNIRAINRYSQENNVNIVSTGWMEDYSDVIIEKSYLFDDAIGYSNAIRSMQLFLTTKRSNLEETEIDMSYEQMKGEVEGFFNDYGKIIAKGLFHKFEDAIRNIIEILFPVETSQRKVLIGRHPW